MFANRKTLNVLEDEGLGLQLRNKAHELLNQEVSGVVEHALTDKGKALAWGASEYDIDGASSDAGRRPYIIPA